MKKILSLLLVLGLCIGLVGCNNKKNTGSSNKTNTSESSLTFKTNGEIEEILSNKGWTGKCSVDRCYIENGITQISKDDNYSEVKNITSLSDDEINGFLDWMETKKDKGLLQDDEWASEKDKTAAKSQVSDENGIDDNEQEDEQEEKEDTTPTLNADEYVSKVKTDIQKSVASDERILNVSLNNKELLIKVDLSQSDPSPLTIEDLAITRTSSITDSILKLSEYYDLWDVITVDFGAIGKISNNKDDVKSNGYGNYFPSSGFILE